MECEILDSMYFSTALSWFKFATGQCQFCTEHMTKPVALRCNESDAKMLAKTHTKKRKNLENRRDLEKIVTRPRIVTSPHLLLPHSRATLHLK